MDPNRRTALGLALGAIAFVIAGYGFGRKLAHKFEDWVIEGFKNDLAY